ncbi:MAG: hypothetical protein KGL09_01045 [Pseudomonadota bacterium]|nr:hypothetical protein [Pseudomonadota bacterium]
MNALQLAQHYAQFGHRALNDTAIVCASMASAVCASGAPGWELYIAHVSEAADVMPPIASWAVSLVSSWATETVRGPTGQRRRQRVQAFDLAWAESAIHAGVALALFGFAHSEQRAHLVSAPTWRRVRDFTREVAAAALEEYSHALAWAWGIERDRLLDQRWAAACALTISKNQACGMTGGVQ